MHWSQSAIFYHIYPLGFCGAPLINDNEEQQRLLKLKEWIPHLLESGVNALYLGPVFESSEHGYDTRDYFKIDQRLGSNESFKDICDALHSAEIRVVLDGVFNHVGREFWAFKDVQEKKWDSPYCDWFMNLNFDGNSPYNDGFWYEGWSGHYNLVKLNLRNPQVGDMIIKAIHSWMDDYHIDGLRLDAADVMDKDFFKRLRHECKLKDPDFWLMGEVIHGDYKLWINDQMLDSTTNYEVYKGLYSSHNDANYFEIAHSLSRQFAQGGIYHNLSLYNFVDNHDVNRLASTLRDEKDRMNVYTLLFTIPGIPSIYYGSEVGITGVKSHGSDVGLRPCLELSDVSSNELMQHIHTLSKIKQALPGLQSLEYEQICVRNKQFVFKRADVYVALNLDNEFAECSFNLDYNLKDCLSEQVFASMNNHVTLNIKPKSAMILVRDDNSSVVDEVKPEVCYTLLEEIEGFNAKRYYVYEDNNKKKYISETRIEQK